MKNGITTVYISHRRKDIEVAKKLTEILEVLAGGRIKIHISGEAQTLDSAYQIKRFLSQADFLLVLLTDRYEMPDSNHYEWDWILYETGLFVGSHEKHRFIVLHHPEIKVPYLLQPYQCLPAIRENVVFFWGRCFRKYQVRKGPTNIVPPRNPAQPSPRPAARAPHPAAHRGRAARS